jgi:hypothetical protein
VRSAIHAAVVIIGVVVCCVCGGTAATDSSAAPRAAASRLLALNTTHQLGTVPQNTTVAHQFSVAVSGSAAVRVLKASSPCGCTVGELGDSVFQPGQRDSITVSYTSGMAEGLFEQEFVIETDSRETPKLTLTLKGEVTRGVLLYPGSVVLDGIQVQSGWKQESKVVWLRWERPGFGKVVCPGFLTCSQPTRQKADTTTWVLTVALAPKTTPGFYNDTIVLPCSSATWPAVKLPVQGQVYGVVMPKPLVVNLGKVQVGATTTASFVLASSVPGMTIESVRTTKPCLKATPTKGSADGRTARIELTTTPAATPGSVDTKVVATVTAGGSKHEVTVPVVGQFLP